MRKAAAAQNHEGNRHSAGLNLDGRGKSQIATGIRFFDHMLEQIARHGGLDLELPRAAISTWTSTTRSKTWASRWAKP